MPLFGSVLDNKDLALGFQPILLCSFTFSDGSKLNLSTHPLNAAEGGFPFPGTATLPAGDYQARVAQQDIAALQSRSSEGVDRIPSVTLHLDNADQELWGIEQAVGWKGAILQLNLILWEADTGNFSSDSPLRFVGICDAPTLDNGCSILTVVANSSHNTGKVYLPIVPIQARCPWSFPSTAAERLDGATNPSSQFWECGYNPDQAGTDPETGGDCRRGNGSFTTCDYTKANCVERGMYTKDSSNRQTGRFGGIQWAPAQGREFQSKSYLQGKTVTVFASRNDAIYGQAHNQVYGQQWVDAKVTNVQADGNSVRGEAVLCVGKLDTSVPAAYGFKVVVNGVEIPYIDGSPDKALWRWNWVASGSRNGSPNLDNGFNGQGDPYGSLATIEFVIYSDLGGNGNSVPTVRVLMSGPQLWVYSDPNTRSLQQTNNNAWVLADLLTWANWQYSELDIASFINAAPWCEQVITYTDLSGNTAAQHNRYQAEFALEQKKSAAEIIQAVLRSFNAQLLYNSDGLLGVRIRQTLADQQPAPIAGSNFLDPIDSKHVDQSAAPGYVAFLFDESTITRSSENGPANVRPFMNASNATPNRVSFNFQDQDNTYADDSISLVDADAVSRAGGYLAAQLGGGGHEITEQLVVLGCNNFDQAMRISNVYLAEANRGNEKEDPRGTRYFEIECSVRAEHLRSGDICLFRYQQLQLAPNVPLRSRGEAIDGILVRILKIQPTENYTRSKITVSWWSDDWGTDAFGQSPAPFYSAAGRFNLQRPPYPWKAYTEQPNSSIVSSTSYNFAVAQSYEAQADGSTLASLIITGRPPVNQFSTGTAATQPPLVKRQGETAAAGGTIPGGKTYVMAIAAYDSAGLLTPISHLIQIGVPSGTDTNTLSTGAIFWAANTSGYYLFAGVDEMHLSYQATGTGTPSSITITDFNDIGFGPPDQAFDHFRIRAKRVVHSGVFGIQITHATSAGFEFFNAGWTPGQWTGYDCSVIGKPDSTANEKILDFRVTGNSDDFLDIGVDPTALGVADGDVLIMRAKPDTFSANTIGDSQFINSIQYFYPPFIVLDATNTSPIKIILNAAHGFATGDEVAVSNVNGNPAANTTTTITLLDPTDPDYKTGFTLDGTTGNGSYTGGGIVNLVTDGMRIDAEIGNMCRIFAGTGAGQVKRILSNTRTVLTVEPWDTIPDATSRFIVEESTWKYDQDTHQLTVADPNPTDAPVVAKVNISNLLDRVLLVQVLTADPKDKFAIAAFSPIREIYVFGGPGNTPAQYERTGFGIEDSATGTDVTLPMPLRRAGTMVDFVIQIQDSPDVDTQIDIIKSTIGGGSGTIFAAGHVTIPSGATGQLLFDASVFAVDPFTGVLEVTEQDVFTMDILTGDATATFTAVLKWKIDAADEPFTGSNSLSFTGSSNSDLVPVI